MYRKFDSLIIEGEYRVQQLEEVVQRIRLIAAFSTVLLLTNLIVTLFFFVSVIQLSLVGSTIAVIGWLWHQTRILHAAIHTVKESNERIIEARSSVTAREIKAA